MGFALPPFERELTPRYLARAIGEFRLRHDDLPDDVVDELEDIEFRLLEDDSERPGAATPGAARQDQRMPTDWLTPREVADLTGCSQRTVRRWIHDGSLPSTKIGRSRRINRVALDDFVDGTHDEAA